MRSQNPVAVAHRRYIISLIGAMVLYMAFLFVSIHFLNAGMHGTPRLLMALLPVLPVILVFLAVLRLLGRVDEFERRVMVESLATAAGITALLSVTYGFLENAGFPILSAWWTWTALMSSWLISSLIIRYRYR